MVNHGIVANEEEAGALALNAGVDMDMQGEVYFKYLEKQVKAGTVKEKQIDDAVRRILRVKFELGLFDDPYKYCSEAREKAVVYSKENLDAALDVAKRSLVLLKNDNAVLPLHQGEKIAVIGELAASKRDLLGSWIAAGKWETIPSLLESMKARQGDILYAEGCKKMGDDKSGFAEALRTASRADKIVLVIGESCDWCGEASSRSNILVPGVQTDLLAELHKLGKPVVVVLMNGRPLDLSREEGLADAMLETWFAGSMGGEAITQVLFGDYNPSGKLTMTFPRNLGQVPLYYYAKNTGRPIYLPNDKYKSKYIDVPNDPLFPFGFGLSYTSFEYSNLQLSDSVLQAKGSIQATVQVKNTGKVKGEEVVQLYVRDLVGSVTRPVKELKGFQKLELNPDETKTVTFTISPDMLAFHRLDMSYGTEPGEFLVFAGGNSRDVIQKSFQLK